MSEYSQIILDTIGLKQIEPWKRVGGKNWAYKSDIGEIFAKISCDKHAHELLFGEYTALETIQQVNVVRVPKPLKVVTTGDTNKILVTEFLNFNGLNKFQGELGKQLANLHLNNLDLMNHNSDQAVRRFGFTTNVCCGIIPVDNNWNDDWVDFYSSQRLKPQVEMVLKSSGNVEIEKLWIQLEPRISSFFQDITVFPSLLHGDLWSGNAGETKEGPVIFDPASFYGHHEFDLAITRMFGGFHPEFYRFYHKLVPQEPGFEERKPLYELYHYLNHWNHFGESYREQSLNIMKKLVHSTK